ncbi:MAG: formylglycine-generating enzyme family protein [Proteobacteria bacterium]|nr:formylglycine-generating enzyme family protein [Pseudomonadota bacterium]MCP4921466.1 formylglycine-generating enzyme family protein [Pseudomonadota bacterium]
MILWLACTATSDSGFVDSTPVEEVCPVETGDRDCDGEICWVSFCGDTFDMGSDGIDENESPAHDVTVPDFELMSTEIRVGDYMACVEAGDCVEYRDPDDHPARCKRGAEHADHAANCLDWDMATDFCAWAGGRLPTEAEWEFAARSGGKDHTFPWGFVEPSCSLANYTDQAGCGEDIDEVCARPDGVTEQGMCDMAGNAFEWVQDWMHGDYTGAPTDGSAWEADPSVFRVMRGGGIASAEDLRTRNRTFHEPYFVYSGMGSRCARDLDPG